MAMLNRNLIRNSAAVVGAVVRLLRQAGDDVSAMLLLIGFVTCVLSVRAAESVLANPVYLGTVLGTFMGGINTMWAAVWVAGDPAGRRATGRIILCASLVPMVIAVGRLGNDYDVFFDILRAIA